jgi:hypothetical protein
MTNYIKFSQFSEANLNDSTTETVGIASGVNIKTPKVITWTTATRPTPPFDGLLGFNTDTQQYEFWDSSSSAWVQLASAVDLLSTFILETPDLSLPNSFALSTLSTGILKSTTGTGIPSISVPLTSIDSLVTSANEILYTTASNVYATTSLSPFSQGLLADVDAPSWRASLGLPTSLPIPVSQGGTGDTSFTPFSVLTAGTSSSSPFQNVVGVGTSGQVLTSNGAGSLPTWQTSSSSGTVNPGLINEVAYYAATGSALSGLATLSNGVLATNNSGVPAITQTLPFAVQLNITDVGTIGTGIWQGTPIALAYGGTNANLTASVGGIFYSTSTAGAILSGTATAGQILQSGASSAPSWSASTFPGTAGSAGTFIRSDGTNWQVSTPTIANAFSINNILYANSANNIVGLASANNGVLITSNSGVPSISSTLPLGVQTNITELGTITLGTWNGSTITVPFGGTGNTAFTAFSVLCGGTSSTSPIQNVVGVGTVGQVLTSQGAGALPTWTSASGTGTVNPGLINDLGYYAAAGSVISPLSTANNGVLITSAGGVPSISSTLPTAVQGNITSVGTITSGIWDGTDISLASGGTNASLTASAGAIVYSTASAMALSAVGSAGQMLLSNGTSAPSWSTATFPSSAGTTGTILRSNGTNFVNSTSTFADTYAASTILYSNGANTVVGLATAINGVLVTNGSGVPSIGSTLPTAVQGNITSLGTITSGVWNGTPVTVSYGGTGDASFTAYSVICAGTTSTSNFQNVVGLGSAGQILTSSGAGALPTWTNASGTGTVNSGLINQVAYYAAAGTTISGLATANAGLLVTSNTGLPSILAGPGTTGNILQSNSSAAPSFSTATYPSIATSTGSMLIANGTNWVASTATYPNTTTINQILYSSSANVVVGLATANNGMLVTSSSGVPSILAGPGTTGNILQSNAAAAPSFSTATYPSTTTVNQILYSSSSNVVGGISTANNAYLRTNGSGVPSFDTSLPINEIVGQTFTGNGTYTPTVGMQYCIIEAVGGGGGGGGTTGSTTGAGRGGGGGAGGHAVGLFSAAQINGTAAIVIGTAAAGGTAGANAGTTGTTVTVTANGGSGLLLVSCTGGVGGNGNTASGTIQSSALGGAGGSGSITNGTTLVGNSGSSGNTGNAIVITGNTSSWGGKGASSIYGAGGQESTGIVSFTGNNATGYGSGGSGAGSFGTSTSFAGGAGTAGIVIITEFVSI